MQKSVSTFLLLLAAFFSASSARADFSIDVSVDVNNLDPGIDHLDITCNVCIGVCQTSSNYIATGHTQHPFAPGAPRTFKGVITVLAKSAFNPPQDSKATDFTCLLGVHAPASGFGISIVPGQPTGPGAPPTPGQWFQPQPGTPFTWHVDGKVPRTTVAPMGAGTSTR